MSVPLMIQGCASDQGKHGLPATLNVHGVDYEVCFDEAIQTTRASGMPAILRDRSGGIIETAPRISGSIFEPWRQDNASLGEGIENTIAFQRRRARFEFVPAGFVSPPIGDPDNLDGSPLPGAKNDDVLDMREYEGEIEVRIWVFVERAFTPGMRSGSWTRSQTTFTRDRVESRRISESGAAIDQSKWTPVRRDIPYERRLLDALNQRINDKSQSS